MALGDPNSNKKQKENMISNFLVLPPNFRSCKYSIMKNLAGKTKKMQDLQLQIGGKFPFFNYALFSSLFYYFICLTNLNV